ncbi:hypothetical protein JCM3765_000384 [Sporobolomyces pararoseus]
MPLSAERSLASTTTEEAVELYWELLVKYRGDRLSGSPADYLVTWPTVEHVKQTARELSDQHYGVSKVIAVAGAVGRILWRPALSNGSNSITFSRSKLSIYTRSKRNNPDYDTEWASWLYLQSAPQLFTTDSPPVPLATHAALPRQLPITPYPRNDKPSWRHGLFNINNVWRVENEQVNTQIVFTVLQRPTPAFLLGKINTDDRADGSPSCTDQIDIKLELKPIGNRDPLDSFSCVFQVKIMQRIMPDGQPGEWIPWVPDDMYIKPEPERQTEPRIKREPRSPGRRSRSPSRSPSAGPSRVKEEPTIKQEPSYTLSHRKRAIYRRFEAAGGLGRF